MLRTLKLKRAVFYIALVLGVALTQNLAHSIQSNPAQRIDSRITSVGEQAQDLDIGSAWRVELKRQFVALEASSSDRRFSAERWFAANIGRTQPAEFVYALESRGQLGEEAAWRLGRALGTRPGNLGFVLDLMTGGVVPTRLVELEIEPVFDPTQIVGDNDVKSGWALGRKVGRLALDQKVSNWRSGLERLPLSGAALQLILRKERERNPWRQLEIVNGPAEDVVATIARTGNLPVPIVLAQGLARKLAAERSFRQSGVRALSFNGPWDRVLLDFARDHGLVWEAVLFRGEVGDEIAWLRLVPRGKEGIESGAAQLVRALEDLARRSSGEEADREATLSDTELELAARFLSCIEWDEPLHWLGGLWEHEGDGMARAALLEAAARGRFEPRLASRSGVLGLLEHARSESHVESIAGVHQARTEAAFSRLPKTGTDGSDLEQVLVEGWQEDSLGLRLLRLFGLAGIQSDSAGAFELARAVLAAQSGARLGEAGLLALEVLAYARASEAPEIGNIEALLARVPDHVDAELFARRLAMAGAGHALDVVELYKLSPAGLRVRLMAYMYLEDHHAAAELLTASSTMDGLHFDEPGSWNRSQLAGRFGRSFEECMLGLQKHVRNGEFVAVRDLLTAACRRTSAVEPVSGLTALMRLELLVGVMNVDRQSMLCERLKSTANGAVLAVDASALGQLAAAPVPGARLARKRLLRLFAGALGSSSRTPAAEVLSAIERSLVSLWARNADAEAESLILEATSVAAGNAEHPVAQKVLFRTWPGGPR